MANSFKYYGVPTLEKDLILDGLIYYVCGLLGNGSNNNAATLIKETIKSETLYAEAKDYSAEYGEGVGQFDKIAFEDVKNRANLKHKKVIREHTSLDIENASYKDLRKNPLLSIFFIRLKYLLIPEAVPVAFEDRYRYYKKYYNTESGKATLEHYKQANGI